MKTRMLSVTEGVGAAVWRLAPLWVTATVVTGLGLSFSSFIDLVQAWAVAAGLGKPALL